MSPAGAQAAILAICLVLVFLAYALGLETGKAAAAGGAGGSGAGGSGGP